MRRSGVDPQLLQKRRTEKTPSHHRNRLSRAFVHSPYLRWPQRLPLLASCRPIQQHRGGHEQERNPSAHYLTPPLAIFTSRPPSTRPYASRSDAYDNSPHVHERPPVVHTSADSTKSALFIARASVGLPKLFQHKKEQTHSWTFAPYAPPPFPSPPTTNPKRVTHKRRPPKKAYAVIPGPLSEQTRQGD